MLRQRTAFHVVTSVVAFFGALVVSSSANTAKAGIVGSLSAPVIDDVAKTIMVDVSFAFTPDLVGGDIEFIQLDAINSDVNGSPLTDFSLLTLTPVGPFVDWFDGTQFGAIPGFESIVILDAFSSLTSFPFTIPSTAPITVGKLTFDYSTLGLPPGDEVTIDITGMFDGFSNSTTLAVLPPGGFFPDFIDPTFAPGSQTVVIPGDPPPPQPNVIPEPGIGVIFAALGITCLARRRRRKSSL